jgi:anti-anti-sigma regulatory factor
MRDQIRADDDAVGVHMPSDIKIYKVRDFIRVNESGEIDFDRSVEIIHQLAVTASFYANHNILVDLRDTNIVGANNIEVILRLSLEMARYGSVFQGKIANIVPDDGQRIRLARQFEASLNLQGFSYKVFTTFESAINWLSEVRELPGK